MEITGKEILKLVGKIISESDTFSVDEDYYWDIPVNELYDVYNKPENLTIGQLTDDWSGLQELLLNEREVIEFHDLTHLSQILKAIAAAKLN